MHPAAVSKDDAKSRAVRCVELATSAKNDETRDYWLKMEQLWLRKAQDAELEAAEPSGTEAEAPTKAV